MKNDTKYIVLNRDYQIENIAETLNLAKRKVNLKVGVILDYDEPESWPNVMSQYEAAAIYLPHDVNWPQKVRFFADALPGKCLGVVKAGSHEAAISAAQVLSEAAAGKTFYIASPLAGKASDNIYYASTALVGDIVFASSYKTQAERIAPKTIILDRPTEGLVYTIGKLQTKAIVLAGGVPLYISPNPRSELYTQNGQIYYFQPRETVYVDMVFSLETGNWASVFVPALEYTRGYVPFKIGGITVIKV